MTASSLDAQELIARVKLRATLVLVVFISAVLSLIAITYRADYLPYAVVALVTLPIFVMAFCKPLWGFYFFLAATLIIEQFDIPVVEPITEKIPFFQNINNFTPIKFSATPAELLLTTIILGWIVHALAERKPLFLRSNALALPTLLLFGALVYGFLLGLGTGGLFNVALWEVRSLVYLCIMVILVPNLVRDRKDLQTAIWMIIGGVTFKAVQGVLSIIYPLQGHLSWVESIVGHEDALFFDTLIVLAVGFILFNARHKQKRFLLLVMPFIIISLLADQRRAAFTSLGLGIGVILTVLLFERPRLLPKILIPLMIVLPVYMAAFWNSDNIVAKPVQTIKSIFQPEGRDALSNLYRIAENENIRFNISERPFTGLGFGNKYEIVAPMATIDFPLWEYITHNAILWFWMKTGMFGFTAFWIFFGAVIMRGAHELRVLKDGYLKSIALFIAVFVMMQLVTSYVDLQLTFYRNMIYLGSVIGLLVCLKPIEESES